MRITGKMIAEIAHEANRVLQRELGEEVNPCWDEASEHLKDSILDGVRYALSGATPRQSHENWLKFKEADGWTYGLEKDFEEKTHPCMVPYDLLPPSQKFKDKLFTSIVSAFREVV
jgi:hypothetical protein